jgi:hypothetical protein
MGLRMWRSAPEVHSHAARGNEGQTTIICHGRPPIFNEREGYFHPLMLTNPLEVIYESDGEDIEGAP